MVDVQERVEGLNKLTKMVELWLTNQGIEYHEPMDDIVGLLFNAVPEEGQVAFVENVQKDLVMEASDFLANCDPEDKQDAVNHLTTMQGL